MALSDVVFRPPTLISERLLLRGYEATDVAAIYDYASDEETTRYMAWDRHRTLEHTHAFLDGFVAGAYRAGLDEYAICLRSDPNRVVGGIAVRLTSELHKTAELGYVLHRQYWGQGLVVEAARLLLARAFESGEVERVFAPIMVENLRSRRVAEKLGFSLEGVLRSSWYLRGRRWDEARYALLRDEWHAQGAEPARGSALWLGWARKISALAQNGLTFAKDPFDRQRYEALQSVASEIMTSAVGQRAQPWPPLVDAALFSLESGYATPKLDVRAAVFRREADGEPSVLMVKERCDGGWTLPGGWVDVGESPAQAVEKEAREESGFEVRATKVVALLDRDRAGHPAHPFHTWKVLMQCEIVGGSAHPKGDGLEIDAVGFFRASALPPLSLPRILPEQIARCVAHFEQPELPTEFD
jgi:RimJ/RimL family protein N-acetyltransferase/ADP-ribose pyrophosphatase YjhB (NUDIX family)